VAVVPTTLVGTTILRLPLPAWSKALEEIAGRERHDPGDDHAHHTHHAHRIPIADRCSIRSGVSVAARSAGCRPTPRA
jgi:hypothetical protein